MVASAANEVIAPPGMPGGAHGQDHICQQDHNHHGGTDLNAAGVGEKHDHERQHDGNSIHVDRCAQRDSDTGDFIGYAHLVLHALLAEGDGGRTGTGAKGVQSCRQSA